MLSDFKSYKRKLRVYSESSCIKHLDKQESGTFWINFTRDLNGIRRSKILICRGNSQYDAVGLSKKKWSTFVTFPNA